MEIKKSKERYGRGEDSLVIQSPEILKKNKSKNFAVVISAIYNQFEIYKSLRDDYGIEDKKIFSYTSKTYEKQIYKPECIMGHMLDIEECVKILEDDDSKKYFKNSINARIYRNPAFLEPNCNMKTIGEYADIVTIEKGDVIIDCGAFNGDTVQLYMSKTHGDCTVHAIEHLRKVFRDLGREFLLMNGKKKFLLIIWQLVKGQN